MRQKPEVYAEIATLADHDDTREEATGRVIRLLNDDPLDSQALFLFGYISSKADNHGLAYTAFRRCCELAPNEAIAWHNLGKSCFELNQREHAETAWRRALKLDPKNAATLDAIGLIHLGRSEYQKTIEYCDRALAIEPGQPDSLANRGYAYLALERWREGWEGYDANVGINKDRSERAELMGVPRWDGSKGKRIFVRTDQGIGDEMSFASCLPDLIRDSEAVTIECDRRTLPIFRRSFPQAECYGTRYDKTIAWHAGKEYDGRVLLGELPRFYRNKTEDFPGTPYLVASPELRLQMRALLDARGRRPHIGLAWSGGRPLTNMARRSLSLEALLPILKCDADFISLEYRPIKTPDLALGREPIPLEIEAVRERHGVEVTHWQWAVQNYEYEVTLALLAELDLVISVTTTVVHAAGALGVPVWCLVPEQVMWRYGTKGSKFHWANSVELYRQHGGEWPIGEIAQRLDGWLIDSHSKRDPERIREARAAA